MYPNTVMTNSWETDVLNLFWICGPRFLYRTYQPSK